MSTWPNLTQTNIPTVTYITAKYPFINLELILSKWKTQETDNKRLKFLPLYINFFLFIRI